MIREIGDQGPSHVMGMVAVKVLHKFPLKSPMPQQTDYVSGGTTSSAGSVGGSSLLGGSTSIHGSTHSGGTYGLGPDYIGSDRDDNQGQESSVVHCPLLLYDWIQWDGDFDLDLGPSKVSP